MPQNRIRAGCLLQLVWGVLLAGVHFPGSLPAFGQVGELEVAERWWGGTSL